MIYRPLGKPLAPPRLELEMMPHAELSSSADARYDSGFFALKPTEGWLVERSGSERMIEYLICREAFAYAIGLGTDPFDEVCGAVSKMLDDHLYTEDEDEFN